MQAQPIPKTPAKGAMLEAWQQSLSEARQIAKMVLGRAASTVVAERKRIYRRNRQAGHRCLSGNMEPPHFSTNVKNSFCVQQRKKRCPYSCGSSELNISASRVTWRRPANYVTDCLNATVAHQQTVYGIPWTACGACANRGER